MAEVGSAAGSACPLAGLDLAPLVWASGSLIAAVVDRAALLLDVNPTFQRLAGRDPRGEGITAFVGQGQTEAFWGWLSAAGADWRMQAWGAFPDADQLSRDFSFAACRGPDATLVLIGEPLARDELASALLDVNETLVEEHRRLDGERGRLELVTQQDALTGIGSRRAFDARLVNEVGRAEAGGSFALVMMDIDHFKAMNDRYGHPAGDAVLRWLGGLLRDSARRGDLVARYGGEEFVAILPGAGATDAARWADRLRQAVRRDRPPGVDVTVTVSMGVADWHQGDAGSDVVARADAALYAAKRSGRDRVVTDGAKPAVDPETADLPVPLWRASAIGVATVEGTVVRRANSALERLVGRPPGGLAVGVLVHPEQELAFTEYVRKAGPEWTKATFGFDPDERGIPRDHVTWARQRDGLVELLIEPAAEERGAVEETLLALVDDLVELQRELEGRNRRR